MNKNQNEHPNLGEQIRGIVSDAIGSMDYEKLNKDIGNTVNQALEEVKRGIQRGAREASSAFEHATANPKYEEQFRGGVGQKRKTQTDEESRSVNGARNFFRTKKLTTQYPSDVKALNGVLGVVFTSVGATFTSIFGAVALIVGFWSASVGLGFGVVAAIFAVMFGIGRYIGKRKKRFKNYTIIVGERKYCEIKELAQRTHQSVKYTVKDIKKMIRIEAFPDAHIDDDNIYFMGDYETYKQYIASKEQVKSKEIEEKQVKASKEQMDGVSKEVLEAVQQGKEFVKEIRNANDLIPGEEISRKLEKLEIVTEKIFSRVQEKPELLSEIRKFMEYYLPITRKLVVAYKEFDMQPIQAENIRKSKAEIEDTIDTINLAFLNLFNSLYENEVMDVASDISVLNTMFAQEGLTKKDFEGI